MTALTPPSRPPGRASGSTAVARARLLPAALLALATPTAALPQASGVPVSPALPATLLRAPPEAAILAQAIPRAPARPVPGQGAYGRDADHEHVLSETRGGEIRPMGELMPKAQQVGRGEYIGVEPDISRATYRFKFLRPGGNVVWVDMDGRTGRVIDVKD